MAQDKYADFAIRGSLFRIRINETFSQNNKSNTMRKGSFLSKRKVIDSDVSNACFVHLLLSLFLRSILKSPDLISMKFCLGEVKIKCADQDWS